MVRGCQRRRFWLSGLRVGELEVSIASLWGVFTP